MRALAAMTAALTLVACADNAQQTADTEAEPADVETAVAPQSRSLATEVAPGLEGAEAFLAENGERDGVITTASGLQYEVLSEGPAGGESPAPGQYVCVHYRGYFADGEEFDSSYSRNQAAAFPSNGVIQGWIEALSMMKPGDQRRLFIHPDLAYGEAGRPGIPPNSLLLFDVELIKLLDGPVSPRVDCAA